MAPASVPSKRQTERRRRDDDEQPRPSFECDVVERDRDGADDELEHQQQPDVGEPSPDKRSGRVDPEPGRQRTVDVAVRRRSGAP